jgi:hypothetical protein
MLFLQHPVQRSLVVTAHLPDSLVAHLVVLNFRCQKLLLLAALLLLAHVSSAELYRSKRFDSRFRND